MSGVILDNCMIAAEKNAIAKLFDIAADCLRDGYRGAERVYDFADDCPPGNVADDAVGNFFEGGAGNADSLDSVAGEVRACMGCSLGKTRKNAVPGEGVSRPDVMVVGEGPGADEDSTGRPFVGNAGKLLDKMLASIGLSRETNCFIANVIKCRPPNNRDPRPDETTACASFLERQMIVLRPKIILCAGRIAAQTLLKTAESTGKLRGRFHKMRVADSVIPLVVTYHPSALLRNDEYKRPAWEDLKMLKSWLDENSDANGAES